MSSEFSRKRELDEICNEFEENWSPDGLSEITEYLSRVDKENRDHLLRALIEIDVELRTKQQLTISGNDYAELGDQAVEIVIGLLRKDVNHSVSQFEEDESLVLGTTQSHSPSISPPKQIGPYKLLQQIGEGGMGSVWMAEQEKPVRRRVALKLIKGAMADKQVIARFEAERQALAMMDHPNIAKVLDAGTTPDGSPYFVMELIEGIPINEYCDRNKLTPNERLKLFVSACKAIQHAHQKGIIHRDLKPSNVLVQMHDGEPIAKVIDFGLAKALQHQTKLTDKTMFTEFGQVVGTLQYMSPEQATMDAMAVDTRTDIYSLGVMLYELLAGSTPIDRETIKKNAVLKVLEVIREKEPPRPSDRLGSSGQKISTIGDHRQIQPNKLRQILRGELDWIVMKALEKDRTRRYETASDFAQDVNNFLNGETVQARPPSAAYRIGKFVKKHRAFVASGSAFAALLVFGIVLTSYLAIKANSIANSERATREKMDERIYANLISLAQIQLKSGKVFDARQSLLKTDKKHRGWEFEYWRSRIEPELVEFTLDTKLLFSERPRSWSLGLIQDSVIDENEAVMVGAASYSSQGGPKKHVVVVWNLSSGIVEEILPTHQSDITAVEVNKDASIIFSCSITEIVAWDRKKNAELWRNPVNAEVSKYFFAEKNQLFLVDESSSLIAKLKDKVVILNSKDGTIKSELKKRYSVISVSDDGKFLAGGTKGKFDDDDVNPKFMHSEIEIIDLQTLQERHLFKAHNDAISSLCFSQDSKKLFSSAGPPGQSSVHFGGKTIRGGFPLLVPILNNREIGVWDVDQGIAIGRIATNGPVSEVFVVPNKDQIAFSIKGQNALVIRDVKTGENVATVYAKKPIFAATFLSSGKKMVLNRRLIPITNPVFVHNDKPIDQLEISNDDKVLFSRSKNETQAWKLADASELPAIEVNKRPEIEATGFRGNGLIATSSASPFLALADREWADEVFKDKGKYPAYVEVYSPPSLKPIRKFEGPNGAVRSLSFAYDSQILAIGWGNSKQNRGGRMLSVYSISTGKKLMEKELGNIVATRISNDGAHVVTATPKGIEVFDIDGDRISNLRGKNHRSFVNFNQLRWSPQDDTFAYCNTKDLQLFEFGENKELRWSFTLPSSTFESLIFSPDGARIFCGCGDGAIRIFNTRSGEIVAELRDHIGEVRALAITKDGSSLFSAGEDKIIRRWSILRTSEQSK